MLWRYLHSNGRKPKLSGNCHRFLISGDSDLLALVNNCFRSVIYLFIYKWKTTSKRNVLGLSSMTKFQWTRGRIIKPIKAYWRALRYPFDYYYSDLNGNMACDSLSKKNKQNSVIALPFTEPVFRLQKYFLWFCYLGQE